jgi:hypothetical protein
MYIKQVQHRRLAPFYRWLRILVRWIEEPGNVLAALGIFLGLSVLLNSSIGTTDEHADQQAAVAGRMAATEFWTLHDAALIDDSGASSELRPCAPVADAAAAPDCAESTADEGGTRFESLTPFAALPPFRWSWQPQGAADGDLRAITAP